MSRESMTTGKRRGGARRRPVLADNLRAGSWSVLIPTAVVLAGVTGIAVATIPSRSSGVISSCYQIKKTPRSPSGQLRVIDAQAGATCVRGEKLLTFNQTGRAGQKGDAGPPGAKGNPGPAGAQGPPGTLAASYRAVNKETYSLGDTAVSVVVPAGTYHVTGKVAVETTLGNELIICQLHVSGSNTILDSSRQVLVRYQQPFYGGTNHSHGTLPISSIVTLDPALGSPRTLSIGCSSNDDNEGFGDRATIEAVSVAPPG